MTTFELGGLDGRDMGKSTGAPDLQRMTKTPKLRLEVPADYRRDFPPHKRLCEDGGNANDWIRAPLEPGFFGFLLKFVT